MTLWQWLSELEPNTNSTKAQGVRLLSLATRSRDACTKMNNDASNVVPALLQSQALPLPGSLWAYLVTESVVQTKIKEAKES
jgi:hypothetical protein